MSPTATTGPAGPSVDSWAAQLGFLRADLATAIERMARRLDLVMRTGAPATEELGEPDGYDGIAARGPVDRLLLSEWLLAAEEPDEFTRRFAMNEVAYLSPVRTGSRPPARLTVLADIGPEQAGSPRLVQLAGLVVLARLAAASQVPLALGIATDDPGRWLEAELPELFSAWRTGGPRRRAEADDVDTWVAAGGAAPGWYFGGGAGAAAARARGLRVLEVTEEVFGPDGVDEVRASIDGRSLVLPLPPAGAAVALLRGRGLRRGAPTDAIALGPGGVLAGLSQPTFTSSSPRVLCRTSDPSVLAAFGVDRARPSVRRREFRRPVLAAGTVGERTVALVIDGDEVLFGCIGKQLSDLGDLSVHRTLLGLHDAAIEGQLAAPLGQLAFHGGDLYARLAHRWWVLSGHRQPFHDAGIVAVGASSVVDMARTARSSERDFMVDGSFQTGWHPGGGCLFGMNRSAAYQLTPEVNGPWAVRGRTATPDAVEPGGRPVGVTSDIGDPALVVVSEGGQLLRTVGTRRTRTITAASGGIRHVSVHPTLPLVVVDREGEPITVVDLATGEVQATVDGAAG